MRLLRTEETASLPIGVSIWTLDVDEKEAIALGGAVRVSSEDGFRIDVLSPIDVPAFGMSAGDPLYVPEEYLAERPGMFEDRHDAGLVLPVLLGLGLGMIAALLAIGFFLGRLTA